jgi:hypothetical protein
MIDSIIQRVCERVNFSEGKVLFLLFDANKRKMGFDPHFK